MTKIHNLLSSGLKIRGILKRLLRADRLFHNGGSCHAFSPDLRSARWPDARVTLTGNSSLLRLHRPGPSCLLESFEWILRHLCLTAVSRDRLGPGHGTWISHPSRRRSSRSLRYSRWNFRTKLNNPSFRALRQNHFHFSRVGINMDLEQLQIVSTRFPGDLLDGIRFCILNEDDIFSVIIEPTEQNQLIE